ncbi:low temperature requirement protein A [Flavobacterium sp.]|uniref:low temperature requirement protein A n=1 Tax=Flavobacterium sp. TaxID=239 RepID=UPI002B4B5A73|nr:low temperature requirement protein A [Flavobacterium sp.]HLF52631.1 low temperature requirement protein A [Flavobacterium sp.]
MKIKKATLWWGSPNSFSEREDERKVSWLELFYDLVYAATIGHLTQYLSINMSWQELGFTFFIFAFIYWSWTNGSLYHDLHGNNEIRTRLFTLLQIIAIAAVAVTLTDLFKEHHQPFAISFTLVQLIITYLWWSTGHFDPSHKPLNRYYVLNYSISVLLFITSIGLDYNTALILWAFALLLNLSTSLVSANTIKKELKKRGEIFTLSATMVERYGLFAIIVLGETVFGIIDTIANIPVKGFYEWTEFTVGIIISFLLWWIYFGMIGNKKVKIGYRYFVLIDYLNLILLFAIGVVGACTRAILSPENSPSDTIIKWIFGIALITILISIIALTYIREHDTEELSHTYPTSKLALLSAVLVLLLTFFSNLLSVLGFMSLITVLLLLPVLAGTIGWINFKVGKKK